MKQLLAKRQELEAKQKALATVFEQAGDTCDFDKVACLGDNLSTVQKAAKVREMNTELGAIGKEVEALVAVETAAADQKAREALLESSKGKMLHPGARVPGDDGTVERFLQKSLGDLFVESDAFKKYNSTEKRSPVVEFNFDDTAKWGGRVDVKDLIRGVQMKTTLDTTGWAPFVPRIDRVVPGALRRPVIADLIPSGTTGANAIKYMEETTTTNAAASVAEGAAKPESALAFTERTSSVRKIATVLPVTDELMEDAPAMRSYVEARLRLFLALAEEAQLYNGSGTAPDLRGLLNVSGIQTQAKGTDPIPDAAYKAITKIRTGVFLEASGMIFHPTDWQTVRLLRTADGLYIWGSPMDPGPERMWGLPVVVTPAATVGTAVVAAFDTAMQLFRRNQVAFAVSDQHQDFFIKNLLMLRVEERLAFVVYRPAAICTVTGL